MTVFVSLSSTEQQLNEYMQYLANIFFPCLGAKRSHAFKLCERLKVSNTMTRLEVCRITLTVSPQNDTKSDLRRSEIKDFPRGGGTCPPTCHTPLARASRTLCDQSHAPWNPPFQNPRSATELSRKLIW